MTPTRRAILSAPFCAAVLIAAPGALAAPQSRLLDAYWTGAGAGGDPDAEPWAALLSRRVAPGPDGVALFDYAGATGAEAAELKRWLADYQSVDPTRLTRPAQMAFWINLYNAKTIELVLDAYPVASIREVRGGLFNLGPWDEPVIRVMGRELSLDDVEHGILRPIWRDPRIHYAVNCASIGCPDLAPAPYASEGLEEMLEHAARSYVAHPRGAAVEDRRLIVSSIYHWFIEDFGGDQTGVLRHLSRYAGAGLAEEVSARIARGEGYDDHRYDWRLNNLG